MRHNRFPDHDLNSRQSRQSSYKPDNRASRNAGNRNLTNLNSSSTERIEVDLVGPAFAEPNPFVETEGVNISTVGCQGYAGGAALAGCRESNGYEGRSIAAIAKGLGET